MITRLLAVVAKYATTLLATIWFFGIVAGCAPRYVPVHHYHETERVKVDTVQLPPELVTKIAPERKPLWAKVVAIIGGMLFLFVVLVELMRMR